MKKYFKVTFPNTLLFESIDEAVKVAQALQNAKWEDYEYVSSDESRDGRTHYVKHPKDISVSLNFTPTEYCENQWEALEKVALYTASPEEVEKRKSMTDEDRKAYMKNIVDTIPKMWEKSEDYNW